MTYLALSKYRILTLAVTTLVLFVTTPDHARQRGARGGPPPTARASAAIDLTGYWVSVITEDWRLRMVTPRKGQYDALTLNAEGRRVGDTWDPDRDEKAGEQCKAYGAANIMRLPGRLNITWETTTRSASTPIPEPRLGDFISPLAHRENRRGRDIP